MPSGSSKCSPFFRGLPSGRASAPARYPAASSKWSRLRAGSCQIHKSSSSTRLGLAPVVVYQLLATLKQLKQNGLTILLVEKNVHLALALSDYAYVIAEGRIFTEGL